jgi:hypothetical protein
LCEHDKEEYDEEMKSTLKAKHPIKKSKYVKMGDFKSILGKI